MEVEISTGGVVCSPSPRTMRVLHRRYLHETRRLPLPGRGPDARPGRRSSPDVPAPRRGHQPTSTQVGIERPLQLSRQTARMRAAYVRASLCAPSELSLCVGRICVRSTGGAYALALLAIGALGESVSLEPVKIVV
jgi:hypothetical protein